MWSQLEMNASPGQFLKLKIFDSDRTAKHCILNSYDNLSLRNNFNSQWRGAETIRDQAIDDRKGIDASSGNW